MTQLEVSEQAKNTLASTSLAFWQATDPTVRQQLMDMEISLESLVTKLNQSDIKTRTDDFASATHIMNGKILPGVKALDQSIEKIINVDNDIKSAMMDLYKLSSMAGFFTSL